MSRVGHYQVVDAPPEEVWRVIADPRNLPRWNQHIREVHDVPSDGLKQGTRYWTEINILGVPFKIRAEVLEIDPPRYSEIRLTGPLEAIVQTWVRPIGHTRSRLEHQVDYHLKGGPVGDLIGQGVRYLGASSILKRGMRAQKLQVERG